MCSRCYPSCWRRAMSPTVIGLCRIPSGANRQESTCSPLYKRWETSSPHGSGGRGGGSGLTVCIALPRAGLGLACGHREAPCCSPSCPVAPLPALPHRPPDACPAAGSTPGPLAAFLQAELASRCSQKGLCSAVCVRPSGISTLWRKSCPHVPGVGASGTGQGDGLWSWLRVHPEVG